MNYKSFYILLAFIACHLPMNADDFGTDFWLEKLDSSLSVRFQLEQNHIDRIEELKKGLPQAKAKGRLYEQNYQLYDLYKSYCYDSARHYAYQCLDIARARNNAKQELKAKFAITFSLISAGILSEAHEMLLTIDRSQLDGPLLEEYYDRQCTLWRTMADYIKEEPYYTKYITQSNTYLDSLIMMEPRKSARWWQYTGSRQMRSREFDEALLSFNHVLEKDSSDNHQLAMIYAEMAWGYIHKGDEPMAMQYFARSAIADNESVTREITALYHLARLIYKQGDYERASNYVHLALEYVNFYNSRLRKVEINDILPIIEQDRYDAMTSQRNWLVAATALFVILLGILVTAYFMIRKRNRKLDEARQTIAGQLEQLKADNARLLEDDKIKDAYIGRSFYTNAEFIAKLEKLYITIDRKIAARQYDDLRSMMKLSSLNAERENMYEAFDRTFLKLFPNFVQRYNELFEEKDRKLPPNEHSLTSEMRIFALIRLGITDSERIAKFLDYSVHTVNTYKTRIKNRSTADNDHFEQFIMEI